MRKAELLLPAGSLVKLKTALLYGADAVYAGTPDMSLRTQSKFSLEDLKEGIDFVHQQGKKIYLTLNLYIHNEEAAKLPQFVKTLQELKPDGVLVADPGVFYYLKENAPELKRFVSTQANICSGQTVKFWQSMGASLCVLGREVTFAEMAEIREQCPDMLLECFVHGAMCMSVSGRCLLSSYMAGRSGNRGECAQPCRWKYNLVEEHRPGQYMEIGETPDNGSYILNANDLCTAPFIDLICKAGVDSLKIEGRAKTFYYVASVVSAYRRALDTFLADPYNDNFELPDDVIEELNRTSHRHYSPGFYFGKEQAQQTPSHTYVRNWDFIGTVDSWENGIAHCTQRGKFSVGDSIEILQPDGSVVELTPAWIENADGERVDATPHPMMQYTIPCETPLMAYSLIRMQKQ